MAEGARAIVEPAFEQMAKHVADSDRGMLWRPIKKLMNRARGVRLKHLTSYSATVAVFSTIDQMDPSIGMVILIPIHRWRKYGPGLYCRPHKCMLQMNSEQSGLRLLLGS